MNYEIENKLRRRMKILVKLRGIPGSPVNRLNIESLTQKLFSTLERNYEFLEGNVSNSDPLLLDEFLFALNCSICRDSWIVFYNKDFQLLNPSNIILLFKGILTIQNGIVLNLKKKKKEYIKSDLALSNKEKIFFNCLVVHIGGFLDRIWEEEKTLTQCLDHTILKYMNRCFFQERQETPFSEEELNYLIEKTLPDLYFPLKKNVKKTKH